MEKANTTFASNVAVIKSKSTSVGDKEFLDKVRDYAALNKLYNQMCGRTTNSSFYMFNTIQRKILKPDMFGEYIPPQTKEEYEKSQQLDRQYGYSEFDKAGLFPIINEFHFDYGKSIWDTGGFFWAKGSFYDTAREVKLGTWKPVAVQQGTVKATGGGTLFTTYVHQEIERITSDVNPKYISIEDADLSELDEKDPYYYIYQKTAGVTEADNEFDVKNKEARAYIQKYGLYSAFLDVDQARIITGKVDENIFVDAGPGTGKTYTLIHKINYLVNHDEVDPESIMVLCFTNAAVAEVKKRRNEFVKQGGSRGLRNVDVRTFHSFAWWLINEYNNNPEFRDAGDWQPINRDTLSYDGTIIKATYILKKHHELVLGGWSHFIVDEIQDLTDVRARLVLEIVSGCLDVECGVSVLGDLCQAIYDYNQAEVAFPLSSDAFYKSMFSLLYGKASFFKLLDNHRQTNELIEITKPLRTAILSDKLSEMKLATKELEGRISHIPGQDIMGEDGQLLLDRLSDGGKICLLCRNNGQVLKLSSQLRRRGVAHVVNAYDRDRCYAKWVAAVFRDYPKQMISKDDFAERYEKYRESEYSAEEVWDRMCSALKKPDNLVLGVEEIIDTVYATKLDDPMFHNVVESGVIVSNIHRAKGREYEAVVVESGFMDRLTSNRKQDIGEYKTLYVAITRPKKGLYCSHMVSSDMRIYTIFATGRKRWLKFVNKQPKYMEIQTNVDIDIESYNKLGEGVQKYIAEHVSCGDEIILRKSKANEILRYDIVHVKDGVSSTIGRMTRQFEDDIEALIQTDDHCQWPYEIRELYVTDVFSQINDNVSEHDMSSVTWNWVEFCGMGRMVYDVY